MLDPKLLRRIRNIGAAVLVTAALIVYLVLGARWRTVTCAEGKFSIEFPGKPGLQRQAVPTQAGTLTAIAYRKVQLLHRSTYEVGYIVYPQGVLEQAGNLENLAIDQALGRVGAEVEKKQPFTAGGHQGTEVTARAPGMGKIRLRVLAVDDQVYMLMVYPVPKGGGGKHAERFFQSFTLRQ
ncbi:MAG: hypothetical protein ACYC6A_15645 [Armatimonadota bacterium]